MEGLSTTRALDLFLDPKQVETQAPNVRNIVKIAVCLKGTRDNCSIGIALSVIGVIGTSFGFTYLGRALLGYGVTLASYHGKKFFEQIHNIPTKN